MTNDGMLSQDEIDALLNGTNNLDETEDKPSFEESLTNIEMDALGEIGNISFGSSATTLATLLKQKVEITTPSISVIRKGELEEKFPVPYVGLTVNYTEGLTGSNLFILESKDAAIIADLMLGGTGEIENTELNEISLSAVQEAMNQMMGTAATSMSSVFNKKVDISPPSIAVIKINEDEAQELTPNDDMLIKVSFQLKIGTLIDSKIMQLLPITFAKELVDQLLQSATSTEPTQVVEEPSESNLTDDLGLEDEFSQLMEEASTVIPEEEITTRNQTTNSMQSSSNSKPKQIGEEVPNKPVHEAAFTEFKGEKLTEGGQRNLNLLLDIPLQVTVELGRQNKTVQEILDLSPGSVVELDKLAGEPVDILINQKLIAKGEVVVIEENFGVRVTDILSQEARLKQLK